MGGMQVLQWAASYPERVFAAVPIAARGAPLGAEHRLPRGRPPGDHGRSRLVRRRLSERTARSPASGLAVARMAAHITYLSEAGAAPQVRPQPAGPRRASPTASTPISRSRAICATRAAASSTASTPTPISTSPARWTISTSPPSTAACWPSAFARHARRASASSPSPPTGCFRPPESRAIVHALNAAGRQCQLRRDRDRQGPRRLPARRAGAVRDPARLSDRLRRASRPAALSDGR